MVLNLLDSILTFLLQSSDVFQNILAVLLPQIVYFEHVSRSWDTIHNTFGQ